MKPLKWRLDNFFKLVIQNVEPVWLMCSLYSMDFTSDILSLELNYDQIITETNFEAEGKLIFLPISTNSTNTVTLGTYDL